MISPHLPPSNGNKASSNTSLLSNQRYVRLPSPTKPTSASPSSSPEPSSSPNLLLNGKMEITNPGPALSTAAALSKITNFSIAAIINQQQNKLRNIDANEAELDVRVKRRRLEDMAPKLEKHMLQGNQEDIDIDGCSEEGSESLKLRETLRHNSSQNGHHQVSSNSKRSQQYSPPPSSTDNRNHESSPRPNVTQVMKKKGSKEDRMRMRSKSNCDELKYVECVLETKDLWDKFHDLETEMIITKTGRRMFPTVRCSFTNLKPDQKYWVLIDIVPCDNKRYRYAYHRSSWLVAGKADPPPPHRLYAHPDAPYSGEQLRKQVVSFEKVKLTNNEMDKNGQMVLSSMHRFQPRVHLVTRKNPMDNSPITNLENENYHTYIYPETVFTAVTAYQNQLITKLKIDSNPFAKGFRDSSRLNDYEQDYYFGSPPIGSMPFMNMGQFGGYPPPHPAGMPSFGPPPTPHHLLSPNPPHPGILDPSTAALLFRSSPLFAAAIAAQHQNATIAATTKALELPSRTITPPTSSLGAFSSDEANNNVMLEKARAAAAMSMMIAKQNSNGALHEKADLVSPNRDPKPIISPVSVTSPTGHRRPLSPSITTSSTSIEQQQLQALLAAHQHQQQNLYAARSAAAIGAMPTSVASAPHSAPYPPPLGMSPALLAQWSAMQQAQAAQMIMQQHHQTSSVSTSSPLVHSKNSFSESSPLLSISKSVNTLSPPVSDSETYSRPARTGFPAYSPLGNSGIQRFSPYIVKQSADRKSPPQVRSSIGHEDGYKRKDFDDHSRSGSPIAVDSRSPRTPSSIDRDSPMKSMVHEDEVDN